VKPCAQCGVPFAPAYPQQRTCSDKCRDERRAYMNREATRRAWKRGTRTDPAKRRASQVKYQKSARGRQKERQRVATPTDRERRAARLKRYHLRQMFGGDVPADVETMALEAWALKRRLR
jgi:hypothetical protein